jgi:diphthine methyl ester synthase
VPHSVDITVKGLEAVKSCDKVFLESYTSMLTIEKSKLVRYFSVF